MRVRRAAQIAVLSFVVVTPAAAGFIAQETIYDRVAGAWRWEQENEDCKTAHRIWFTPDRRQMLIAPARNPKPGDTTRYDILGVGPSVIRGRITDESRRTEAGEVVAWDLVLYEPDTYCWHRTDWPSDGCTRSVRRCRTR